MDIVGEILIKSTEYAWRRVIDITFNSVNAAIKLVKAMAQSMYQMMTAAPRAAMETVRKLWDINKKMASFQISPLEAARQAAAAVSSGAGTVLNAGGDVNMPSFTDLFAPSAESEKLKSRIDELLGSLRDKVEQMITLNEWGDAAYEAGSNFANRFIEGVKTGFNKIKAEVTTAIEGIKKAGDEIMALYDEIEKLKDNRPELDRAVDAFMERNPDAMQMQIDLYRKLYAEMLKLKELEDKKKQAANIREDLKTPMDKYADKLNEVMDLYKEGLLTKEEAFAAAEKYKPKQQGGRNLEGFSGLRDFSRQIQQSILGNQQAQRDQERNQSLKRLVKINEDMHKAIKEKEEGLA